MAVSSAVWPVLANAVFKGVRRCAIAGAVAAGLAVAAEAATVQPGASRHGPYLAFPEAPKAPIAGLRKRTGAMVPTWLAGCPIVLGEVRVICRDGRRSRAAAGGRSRAARDPAGARAAALAILAVFWGACFGRGRGRVGDRA